MSLYKTLYPQSANKKVVLVQPRKTGNRHDMTYIATLYFARLAENELTILCVCVCLSEPPPVKLTQGILCIHVCKQRWLE